MEISLLYHKKVIMKQQVKMAVQGNPNGLFYIL